MKKNIFRIPVLSLLLILIFASLQLYGQGALAEKVRIDRPDDSDMPATVFVTVGKKEKKIAESVYEVWIINGGKEVLFAGSDGSGGFENEGQSLNIYNVADGSIRKVLSEYFMIEAIAEHRLANGKRVILVRMGDGGLGASYFAVVDPERGEIFFRREAELLKLEGDRITLGFYGDWEEFEYYRDTDKVLIPKRKIKPDKTETHDLKKILTNEVIFNENSFLLYEEENENLKRVKIHLWRKNDVLRGRDFILVPVSRFVDPKAPLRPALEALFAEPKQDERENGLFAPTTGYEFGGVVLKKGTALIKLSATAENENVEKVEASLISQTLKQTARQFPTVKKVKICVVGNKENDPKNQFPKCSE